MTPRHLAIQEWATSGHLITWLDKTNEAFSHNHFPLLVEGYYSKPDSSLIIRGKGVPKPKVGEAR